MRGYQLKITLRHTSPPVWRRIWIPHDMTFYDLHEAIQVLFGWRDAHPYDFLIRSLRTRVLSGTAEKDTFSNQTLVPVDTPLDTYLKEGVKLVYTYDYEDRWEHQIVVEKEDNERYPFIHLRKWRLDNLADEAGGVEGYNNILEIVQNKSHKQHRKMKKWLEKQHIPFDASEVREELALIGETNADPIMSSDVDAALDTTVAAFLEQLDKTDLPIMCLLQACEANSDKLIVIATQEKGYNIQLYNNELDYIRGVENTPDLPGFNLFANGISILSSDDGFMPWDGWVSEDEHFIVRKMRTGFMPMDLDDETAIEVVEDIRIFTEILQKVPKLPGYEDGRMIRCFRQPNGKLSFSYPRLRFQEDPLEIHLKEEWIPKLKSKDVTVEDIRIDMITNSHEDDFDYIHMPIYLVMENDEYQLKIPLDGDIYHGYESLARCLVETVGNFININGRMHKIIVNSQNMAQILTGLCEDISIPLCIEDFMTEAQEEITELARANELEMLGKLADLDEDEFYDFLDCLSDKQREEFQAIIEQNMDKLGLSLIDDEEEEEEEEETMSKGGKKFFDA